MTNPTKQTANILYPLKPNYKGKTKGWFCFLHHDTVLEYSHNVKERTAYVRKNKSKGEMKARREHMISIPDEMVPKYIKEADQKRGEANQKREEADQKWGEAYQKWEEADQKREEADQKRGEAHQKRGEAYQKWEEVYQKWEEAYQKASKSPRIAKFLKENTPYQWDEANQTLIY